MALKLAKVAGEKKKVAAPPDTDLGIPTTQVRMGTKPSVRPDPLSTVSIMDQLKTATPSAATSKGLPLIGHLPVVKQFQILGLLLLTFLALAVLMLFLDGRTASQQTASFATTVDMQMLSQRVTRSSVLATQGQSGAVQAVRESRDRFQEDLNAFLNGGSVRGDQSLITANNGHHRDGLRRRKCHVIKRTRLTLLLTIAGNAICPVTLS